MKSYIDKNSKTKLMSKIN